MFKVNNKNIRTTSIIIVQNYKLLLATQLRCTCSKSTIGTLEKGVKHVQS